MVPATGLQYTELPNFLSKLGKPSLYSFSPLEEETFQDCFSTDDMGEIPNTRGGGRRIAWVNPVTL